MYKMIDTSQALNSAAVSTVLEWGQKHTHTFRYYSSSKCFWGNGIYVLKQLSSTPNNSSTVTKISRLLVKQKE